MASSPPTGFFPTIPTTTALKQDFGPLPDLKTLQGTRKVKLVRELLRAWDPIAQKTVWEQETSSGVRG
jgi:quinohemoprotein ethanol dehydrogenase